jgi:dCTP deaminase
MIHIFTQPSNLKRRLSNMLLLEDDLKRCIANGEIEFTGTLRKDSLLLCLGANAQLFSEQNLIVDPYDDTSLNQAYGELIKGWSRLSLNPRQFILVSTEEYLRLDPRHYGIISTLSHVARFGLMAHPSSFVVDRGFKGYLTFEIYNFSPHVIVLSRGMPIAKLLVFNCGATSGDQENIVSSLQSYYGVADSLRSCFYDEFEKP